jgi:hypothetical protein
MALKSFVRSRSSSLSRLTGIGRSASRVISQIQRPRSGYYVTKGGGTGGNTTLAENGVFNISDNLWYPLQVRQTEEVLQWYVGAESVGGSAAFPYLREPISGARYALWLRTTDGVVEWVLNQQPVTGITARVQLVEEVTAVAYELIAVIQEVEEGGETIVVPSLIEYEA